jgi:hypothetical protein
MFFTFTIIGIKIRVVFFVINYPSICPLVSAVATKIIFVWIFHFDFSLKVFWTAVSVVADNTYSFATFNAPLKFNRVIADFANMNTHDYYLS